MKQPRGPLTSLCDLPPEIINGITSLLGDVDFCACVSASRLWRAHSPADYARRIVASRAWSVPSDLLAAGNTMAVRGLVALGRMDLSDHAAAPCLAAYRGHFRLLVALHEMDAPGFDRNVMDCAVDGGHLDIVVFLQHHRQEGCTTYAMNRAAARGRLDIVDFLHRHRTEGCTRRAIDYAAANGHLDVVIYLCERRTEGCSVGAVNRAAANGHRDIVAYLLCNRTEGSTAVALAAAAANGDVPMLHALTDDCPVRQPGDRRAMDAAAANGHLGAVAYLDERRSEGCTGRAIADAADAGHFNVVLFLLDRRPAVDSVDGLQRAADAALAHGRLDVYDRIAAQMLVPYTPSAKAFVGAARSGHVATLRMLHRDHQPLFDQHAGDTIAAAVAGGHVDAYSFCIETTSAQSPLRHRVHESHILDGAVAAIASGHNAMVAHTAWALCGARESCVCEALEIAAAAGNLTTIELVLRYKNCYCTSTRPRVAGAAAAAGHVGVVAWLINKALNSMSRGDVAEASIRSAAAAGRNDVLDWLARRVGCDPRVWQRARPVDAALVGGHVSTLRLLRDPAFGRRTGYHRGDSFPHSGADADDNKSSAPPAPSLSAWLRAAHTGHLGAMRHLHAEGARPDVCSGVMSEAIKGGHLDVVKFVYRTMPERHPQLAIKEADRHQQHAIATWLTEAIRCGAYRPTPPPSPWPWLSTPPTVLALWSRRATGKTAMMRDMLRIMDAMRDDPSVNVPPRPPPDDAEPPSGIACDMSGPMGEPD
ncbi:Ankyrin repeat domain containing protein [Pandoravirus salinus]|uniref:Ankyrin repeat domain containing protein n=1 Tax=Pandoravirus salinus TaxID=1349410 RepID=S4W0W4_9VIRU|nr:ankyrin repeat domain [Pandoravirus salinus]AGO84027.1 Ankyrin repeat domain containing protein [Pandoravirus salinus]